MRVTKIVKVGTTAIGPVALLASAAPAWSQQVVHQGVSVPRNATAERKIDISLELPVVYDSNTTRSSEARAAARGLEREDVRITPAVGVDISVAAGRGNAYLAGSAGYDFHLRNERLNGERISLYGGLSHPVAICDVEGDAGFQRVRSDLGDLGVVNTDPLEDFKNIETTYSAGLTASCGNFVGFKPFGQVSGEWGENSNNRRKGSDYYTLTYGGGILYTQPSIGEFGLIGSVEDTRYDNRETGGAPGFNGLEKFSARSVGLYFNRNVTRRFRGSIQVNYTDIDSGNGVKAFNGLSGEAQVTVSPGGPFQIEARAARAATAALSYDIDYFVETLGRLTVRTRLSERLSLATSGTLRGRDYYSTTPNLVRPLTDDEHYELSAGLQYRRSERLDFGLEATYEHRNANGSFYDYESTRLMFTVRFRK